MRLEPPCVFCLLQWVYGRSTAAGGESHLFFTGLRRLLTEAGLRTREDLNTALLSNYLVENLWAVTGDMAEAFYQDLKRKNNANAAGLLPRALDFIEKGREIGGRLERACMIAAAANVAPLGVPSRGFEFSELKEVISGRRRPVIRGDIFGTVKKARRVLYVTDNAGEIGFDSLLISILKEMASRVTLVVKEPTFFEDATPEDVRFFELESLVDEIVTVKGVFIPGESYPFPVSRAFEEADLIVSKGTGNFEALRGEIEDKSVVYMLKVKCDIISEATGTRQGRFVIDVEGPQDF